MRIGLTFSVFQELDEDEIEFKKKQQEELKKLKEAAIKAGQKGPMGSESHTCFQFVSIYFAGGTGIKKSGKK